MNYKFFCISILAVSVSFFMSGSHAVSVRTGGWVNDIFVEVVQSEEGPPLENGLIANRLLPVENTADVDRALALVTPLIQPGVSTVTAEIDYSSRRLLLTQEYPNNLGAYMEAFDFRD